MTLKTLFSKKIVLISGAAVLLYALIGFFLLPVLGKNLMEDKLSRALNREVLIQKVGVNPFALITTIEGLVVKDKNKEIFFSAQKISANLSLSSIFLLAPVVSDFSLEGPYIHFIRNRDHSFNVSDLATEKEKNEPVLKNKAHQETEIFGFVLKNVRIKQGEIRFSDKVAGASHLIKDFSLTLDFKQQEEKQG